MAPYLYLLIVIVAMALVFGTHFFLEHKRSQEMQRRAMDMGFTYNKNPDKKMLMAFQHFAIFNRGSFMSFGSFRKIYNLCEGRSHGLTWRVFDYKYTIQQGKNSSTYKQSICHAKLPNELPKFSLTHESIFHKIGSAFGYKDINFETNPEFSKKYFLRGPQEEQIRKIFNSYVLSFFESETSNLSIEADRNEIIFYRARKRIKPIEIREFIDECYKIVSVFNKSAESVHSREPDSNQFRVDLSKVASDFASK
ncbi:MAG: hypothetical protein KKD94_06340 [Nanoarchaeota archaeon]|nr:hypothetical protein [Nanoarchaeota archaeon]